MFKFMAIPLIALLLIVSAPELPGAGQASRPGRIQLASATGSFSKTAPNSVRNMKISIELHRNMGGFATSSLPGIGGTPKPGRLLARNEIGSAEDARMTLEHFEMRGLTADGRKQWDLHGGNAIVEGPLANLKDVLVVFYTAENEPIDITSPLCLFNRVTKVGGSEAPLQAKGRSMTISGVGYDIFAAEQRLHIRSQVRMRIKDAQSYIRDESIFDPRGKRRPAPATGAAPADGKP